MEIENAAEHLPRCTRCGSANVFLNVNGGAWFSNAPRAAQVRAFDTWLAAATSQASPLLILEVGAGYNTPSVIRHRSERLLAANAHATLVRINKCHAELDLLDAGDEAAQQRYFAFAMDATQILPVLLYSSV